MAFGTPNLNLAWAVTVASSASFTTGAPTSGRIMVFMADATRGSSTLPADLVMSGSRLTWTAVFGTQPGTGGGTTQGKGQWWWTVADGSSDTFTITSTSGASVGGLCIDFSIGAGNTPDFTNQAGAGAASGTAVANTDPSVTLPTTPGANDLGLFQMFGQGGSATSAPAGYTAIQATSSNTRASRTGYDLTSPAQSLTWTNTANPAAVLTYVALVETSGGTTYPNSLTETASTSDTETSTLTTADALTESVTTSDTETVAWTAANSLTETVTTSDADTSRHSGLITFQGATNTQPSGWTNRFVTTGYTATESSTSNALRFNVTVSGRHMLSLDRIDGSSTFNKDIEVTFEAQTGSTKVSGNPSIGVMLRASGSAGSENGYRFSLGDVTGTGDGLQISKYTAGVSAGLTGGASAFTWSLNTKYTFRCRINGTTLSIKCWASSGSEPGSPQISITDSSFSNGGWTGFFQFLTGNTDFTWFGFATDGDTAPLGTGTTYNDSLTETVTTSETFTSLVTFPNALTESATTSDTETSTATFPNVIAETAASGDTFATAVTFPNTLTETSVTGDTFNSPTGNVFNETITETATTSDTRTSTLTAVNSVAEVVATGDIYVGSGGTAGRISGSARHKKRLWRGLSIYDPTETTALTAPFEAVMQGRDPVPTRDGEAVTRSFLRLKMQADREIARQAAEAADEDDLEAFLVL